jgi:hypothetical protein
VDEDDLAGFIPNWLWHACWQHYIQEMQQQQQMAMMMTTTSSTETSLLSKSTVSEQTTDIESPAVRQITPLQTQQSAQPPPQPIEVETVEVPIAQQIADLQEVIQLLESLWAEDSGLQDEIQAEDWQRFMNDVHNSLTELQEKDIITQDKVED